MRVKYPNLAKEISVRGIKKKAIASAMGISEKTLSNKLSGVAPFTWPEACVIASTFFPDMSKDVLFSNADIPTTP